MSLIGDPSQEAVALKATAVLRGDKLIVSAVRDGSGTSKLIFSGDYYTEDKSVTNPEKYEAVEKQQKFNGILMLKEGSPVVNDFTKFEVIKVESIFKRNYNVTITLTGFRKVGMSQVFISAEFKGEGDIRLGEGAGRWHIMVEPPLAQGVCIVVFALIFVSMMAFDIWKDFHK